MDRRERIADPEEALRLALDGKQAQLWTALPAIVDSFDAARMTANVQPTIKAIVRQEDGTYEELQLPLLLDCPVQFPGGGGVVLTFPLAAGDEVLVVFASRCMDGWWQLGGIQPPLELRMHDLSDGFVIPQVRSQPRKLTVSTTAAQLRTDDGTAYVELNGTSKAVNVVTPGSVSVQAGGNATVQASGSMSLTAPTITLTGNVTVNGNFGATGTMTNNGKNIGSTHTHSGVQTGAGNTGAPN